MRHPVIIILSVNIAPPEDGARFRMECAFNDLARAVALRLVERESALAKVNVEEKE
jgi:hypothetical protein